VRNGWRQGLDVGRSRALVVFVPTVFVVGITSSASHWQPDAHPLDALGFLWLVAAGLPLLVRQRFPLTVFVVVTALTVSYYWSNYPGGPVIVLPTIALFTLTRRRGPLVGGIASGAVIVAGYAVYLATGGRVMFDARVALFFLWAAAVVGIGTAVRNQVAAARASRDRAAEHRYRLAEQERLQIARDVHDVVAHSLAMINVQAGVAAHVADRRPEQAKEALQNIKEASAAALNDLRATLAVLRSGEDRGPAPSLRQMSELLDHARATGLSVRVQGSPGELPAPTDGAAYRILQESLTNVVRHATQPRFVDVEFARRDGLLELVVRDDGMGASEPKHGNGLRGMGERAAALGGRVLATPVDGGFEVRAELPIEGEHP
jgi:signal transduction histidine kinase